MSVMRETCNSTSGLSRNSGIVGGRGWGGKGTPNWCLIYWSRANNSEMISISRLLSSSRGSKSESEVAQSCLTLSDPMDCSLWGSSIHGIFQARVLDWVAVFFSRGSHRPRNEPGSPALQADDFTLWATGKLQPQRKPSRGERLVNSMLDICCNSCDGTVLQVVARDSSLF